MEYKEISMGSLELNEGQIDGLPSNPRSITESNFNKLKKDIEDYPEMLEMRSLLVYPQGKKFVIIGGNMRFRAMQELGMETAPCVIIPEGTPVERLKAYTILDNNGFGQWDFDMLANEWDANQLDNWGVDLPVFEPKEPKSEDEEGGDEQSFKIAYELVFNDEAEQTDFYDLLRELKNRLQDYDTISERMIAALRFWKENYDGEE